jgi:hypothetical protein
LQLISLHSVYNVNEQGLFRSMNLNPAVAL